MQAITSWSAPTILKELQHILQILKLLQTIHPECQLPSPTKTLPWSTEAAQAFQQLKKRGITSELFHELNPELLLSVDNAST